MVDANAPTPTAVGQCMSMLIHGSRARAIVDPNYSNLKGFEQGIGQGAEIT